MKISVNKIDPVDAEAALAEDSAKVREYLQDGAPPIESGIITLDIDTDEFDENGVIWRTLPDENGVPKRERLGFMFFNNPPREFRVLLVEMWLKSKRATLWLNWTVTDSKARHAAAEFVVDMIDALQERYPGAFR